MKTEEWSEDFIPPQNTKDPELGTPSLDLVASFFRYLDEAELFTDIELFPAEVCFRFSSAVKRGFTVYKPKLSGEKIVVALITEFQLRTRKRDSICGLYKQS
jgi:hypothetical protein